MSDDLPKTSAPRTPEPFRLGELEVMPASNEIRGRRGVERLRPLLMEVLVRLARDPGEVVRRETLLEDVWPRRMVNDEVLSRAIAELRTALGDDARDARYIETLPKVGYRLVAAVGPLAPGISAYVATPPPPVPSGDPAPTGPTAIPEPGGAAPALPARRRIPWAGVALTGAVLLLASAGTWQWQARTAVPDASLERQLAAARPLTADPAAEVAPRFSPDGRKVAYVVGVVGDNARSRLIVQDLEGAGRLEVGAAGQLLHSPVFFPDGERIAYWRGVAGDCEVVEMRLATREERRLVDCALSPRTRFDLSPDGRYLAFTGNTRPQYPAGLWLAEIGRGGPRALTAPEPGMGEDLYPRFSPDGTRIAFFRGDASHRRPWLLTREAPGDARAISTQEGLSYGFAWLGGDGPLLVAADWLGFRALNLLDIATGTARLAGARGARFPDVSTRGDVVYESAIYAANLWLLDAGADPSAARVAWKSTRYTNQPEFSPDGTRLAFSSNREGIDAIYVAPLDGEPRRLASAETHRYLRPHWSADGRSVIAVRLSLLPGGRSAQEAVRLPADGGAAQVIAALGQSVNDARETRDGKYFLWGEVSGHAMRLMRAPIASPGAAERLPLPLVSQYHVNSRFLVFAQPQMERLTRCRLADWACEPIEVAVAEADLFHWMLAERSLYLRTGRGGEARIERRDAETGRVIGNISLAPTGAGSSIAVTPDESRLAVVREEGPLIDLMIARR